MASCQEAGLVVRVGPRPGDDAGTERSAGTVAPLAGGHRFVDGLGMDVPVVVQVALEHLGPLLRRQLASCGLLEVSLPDIDHQRVVRIVTEQLAAGNATA